MKPEPLKGKAHESLQRGEQPCFYFPDVASAVKFHRQFREAMCFRIGKILADVDIEIFNKITAQLEELEINYDYSFYDVVKK
jgi:hypothetical protein